MTEKRWGYWTRDRIIVAFQIDAAYRGCPPCVRHWEFATKDHPNRATVARVFGSWNAGLTAAGFTPRRVGSDPVWSRESISQAIFEARHLLGRLPTSVDMRRLCRKHRGRFPDVSTVASHFGSWSEALRQTGYRPHHDTRRRRPVQQCARCRGRHFGFQPCPVLEAAA